MLLTDANPRLTWNVVDDVRNALSFHFMVNAFRAGTAVAVVAAAIGWFMVLRHQTFAGHTLSVVGFPGAAAAVWLGLAASWGYFAACIVAAAVIALAPQSRGAGFHEEGVAIGTVQAFALACGFLFVRLYGGFLSGVSSLLFGSFLGVTDAQVVTLSVVGAVVIVAVALMARPLLFASVDPDVARARGVPVQLLSVAFLLVLGVAVAEASQITGSLLVFALLVAPAATAQALTPRPVLGLVVAVGVGVAVVWVGLGIGFYSTRPIGFWITTVAFSVYLLARLATVTVARR